MKNTLKLKIKLGIKGFHIRFFKFFSLSILFLPCLVFSSCINNNEYTYITKIIDGDTFEDENKIKYRLLGIDTPESFDSTKNFASTIGIQKFFATKATNLSSKIINNKKVIINNWKQDKYKRIITRIKYQSNELSKLLLQNGLAIVKYISPIKGDFFYYPDTDYFDQLVLAENYAKLNKIGIWSLSEYERKIVFPKLNK